MGIRRVLDKKMENEMESKVIWAMPVKKQNVITKSALLNVDSYRARGGRSCDPRNCGRCWTWMLLKFEKH